MVSAPISVIGILLLFGDTFGDSVIQTEGHITLLEGSPLILNCSYKTNMPPYLLWYIQYPNEALKLFVSEASGKEQEKDNKGFWTKKITEKSSFHLEKTLVQVGDAAVYYCVMSDTVMKTLGVLNTNLERQRNDSESEWPKLACYPVPPRQGHAVGTSPGETPKPYFHKHECDCGWKVEKKSLFLGQFLLSGGTYGDSVTQTEGHITLPEGVSLTLNCSYQTSAAPYLFWYVQYPNGNLKLLLRETSGKDQKEDKNGFWARKIKEKSLFYLEKASVQMGDSAVYYCVLSDTVMEAVEGAEHKFCEAQETS